MVYFNTIIYKYPQNFLLIFFSDLDSVYLCFAFPFATISILYVVNLFFL